jgi:hypothetical protein
MRPMFRSRPVFPSLSRWAAALSVLASLAASPAPPVTDPRPAVLPFTGEVSLGYETDYLFRGVTFGTDAPWASGGLNLPLGHALNLDLGVWYINPTQDRPAFDELDLFTFLNFRLLGLDASLGGTYYLYPEEDLHSAELSLGLSRDLRFAELGVFVAHDFVRFGGWYGEARALRTIPLHADLDLNLGTGISRTAGYFANDGWNHAYLRAGLGWYLSPALTMNAYLGGNFPLAGLDGVEPGDTLHGGFSLSVGF